MFSGPSGRGIDPNGFRVGLDGCALYCGAGLAFAANSPAAGIAGMAAWTQDHLECLSDWPGAALVFGLLAWAWHLDSGGAPASVLVADREREQSRDGLCFRIGSFSVGADWRRFGCRGAKYSA